jgi:hypothetical protein
MQLYRLVETIEMDISFDNFGVWMQKISKEQFIMGSPPYGVRAGNIGDCHVAGGE